MKKLIAANWKMNPASYREAEKLCTAADKTARQCTGAEVALCVPFPWLTDLSHKHRGALKFGAQDVFWENAGPFTGEVSPVMLKSAKVSYVIVGHSERRHHLAETDAMISKKVKAALVAGLSVILCVGESLVARRKGAAEARKFVGNQLKEDVRLSDPKLFSRLWVAYEPIWSISTSGSGLTETPEDAARMIAFVRDVLRAKSGRRNPRVLYGGSVNARDAKEFLAQPGVDGVLVGQASLNAADFSKIILSVGLDKN